jgi:D-alanyl-D-alanine carboxypeptidase/D-alanyl-D-alanine-endopeptidase (penicillin-binding protein 4)
MSRRIDRLAAKVAIACAASVPTFAGLAARAQQSGPEDELRATIAAQMAQGPATAGAYVVDLTDGHVVFDERGTDRRLAASVTKLYTTATALMEFGPRARGSGASVERLATRLRGAGLRRISGRVFGDATLYSDNGGTAFDLVLCRHPLFGPGCPYGPAGRLERPLPNGPRTPIGFDRGLVGETGAEAQRSPASFAARGLIRALRRVGVRVDGGPGAARTPRRARRLAATRSPAMARLVTLVNRPSDNYAADSLLRLIGARVDGDGSGVAGARAVRRAIRRRFGFAPQMESGSGETLHDRTSPREVVTLLRRMRKRPEGAAFARSLSQAGRSGTLLRFAGSVAEGRCQLKDGTRVDRVQPNTTLNISGYCTSLSGRMFAFAVMMNGMPLEFVPPDRIESPAYALQDAIVKALAGYRG